MPKNWHILKSARPLAKFQQNAEGKMSLYQLFKSHGEPLLTSEIGGIYKAMFWDRETDDLRIYVNDSKAAKCFVLNPPKFLAMDAWNHVYYYADAALRGITNPKRLVPAEILDAA